MWNDVAGDDAYHEVRVELERRLMTRPRDINICRRDHYRADKAPVKEVVRYVSPNTIAW